jgi:hypothetical protein
LDEFLDINAGFIENPEKFKEEFRTAHTANSVALWLCAVACFNCLFCIVLYMTLFCTARTWLDTKPTDFSRFEVEIF